jgi:hypothetical protein
VLAVVQHEQQIPIAQVGGERRQRPLAGPVAQAQRERDRLRDEAAVLQRREVDQPDAVAEAVFEVHRDPERQPGLAHSPDAGEREEPRIGQLPLGIGQLAAATDETGQLPRQTRPVNLGCAHRRSP